MVAHYSSSTVRRAYAFLHAGRGVTEVSVLHPEYRAGDVGWNRARRAWPLSHYISSAEELLDLVRQYAGERMVCYGVNPRPAVLRRDDGRLRSAKEGDIAVSMNLLVDVDLQGAVSASRFSLLRRFLGVADEYFRSLGIARPFRASTGRGSHLLFPYAPILVAEHPDVRERLRRFKDDFAMAFKRELSRLEARVDSTQDLRRMVRVYGTAKPGVGVVSKFYGTERVEDDRLREYLLGLDVMRRRTPIAVPVMLGDCLPEWFTRMLGDDARLRDLWDGRGKPAGTDGSVSGYDYSVVRYLVVRGRKHPGELGTILSLRPSGLAERCAKGLAYVARTVARALA